MKKIATILSICTFIAAFLMGNISKATAGDVDVNIGVNVPLPGLVVAEPPALVVIPGTYVYFAPDIGVDLFFYHDHWYRHHDRGWYIASDFNGHWRGVRRLPTAFRHLPPNYHHIPPGHQRMPYGHVKGNWRTWERQRYWDKHDGRGRGGFDHRGGPSEGRGNDKGKR